jgi:ABC-type nitrate/sulfonate/bicarbonate transport system substrate-binding protein
MTDLKLICFPGAPNLPIFAAIEKGWFAANGVNVKLTTTPSSAFQAENLANGTFDIAGTAFDNVVAYREKQGAVVIDPVPDFFAFMGATQIELALVTAKDVKSVADLKGRSVALDALATGFAFVLYEMLERAGLKQADIEMAAVGATPLRWESVRAGTHAATLTIEPFTSIARAQGFNVVETSTNMFAAYQGGSFAARYSWAAANADAVKGFIRGYLKGLEWTLDPANRDEAVKLLLANMDGIKPEVAPKVVANLVNPRSGLTPKAAFLPDGVATVLELRRRYGGGKANADAARYIDTSLYDDAVKGV